MKLTIKHITIVSLSILLLIGAFGCQEEWLTENPLSELSEASFWRNENDALLALNGLYALGPFDYGATRGFSHCTDDSRDKMGTNIWRTGQFFDPTDGNIVSSLWSSHYKMIYRANMFLENIDRIEMDATLKEEYIAQVKFFRAEQYFWLSFRYGDVPLVTHVLSVEEANSVSRTPRQQVEDFVLQELTDAAISLPWAVPADQLGRILKGAALTYKARLLMIHKKWPEAALVLKQIIDSGEHLIDPRFSGLWTYDGNLSKEIIYSKVAILGISEFKHPNVNYAPEIYGGFQEVNTYQETVDAFLMIDGLSIEESPMYDADHPFDNRDPRLYESIFLPEYTVFRGSLYLAHPDSTKFGIRSLPGATGYHCKKFMDQSLPNGLKSAGQDAIYIRYAEVLLSYLECMIESGQNITQDLLDQTINQIRGREAINMPPVTETSPDLLREILRREWRVEFLFEPFMRHMCVHRWDIWPEMMNITLHGMKLTDDPENYTTYPVDEKGHLIIWDRTGHFFPYNRLLPIPQGELDINPNLTQNPGY